MPEPEPIAPGPATEGGRSRAGLWATLAIVLGVFTLFSGALGVLLFSGLKDPRSSLGLPTTAPSASALTPALPAPLAGLPSPQAVEPERGTPLPLAPPPGGAHARLEEARALLPIHGLRPIWGNAEALATVAVFGDPQCPHTRRLLATLPRLQTALGAKVRFVYFHAPLAAEERARDAARLIARATLRHGPDAGFRVLSAAASSSSAAPNELTRWLSQAALPSDPDALGMQPDADRVIEEDERLAAMLDVRVTPTLFINGFRLEGEGAEMEAVLERVIQDEFVAVRWLRAQGGPVAKGYLLRVRRNLIDVEGQAADRFCVPLDGAPLDGPPGALLTIVQFSDFECTHCRDLQASLGKVLRRYPKLVRRSFRSFPAPQHAHARRVAIFALAARATAGDSAFWLLHDALFEGDFELDDLRLLLLAERLGLDGDRLLANIHDPQRTGELEADERVARDLGLEGNPTLFVNGRRLSSRVSSSELSRIVEEELRAARRITQAGSPASEMQRLLCEREFAFARGR